MSSASSNPWTREAKKCQWQKIRRRSLSLSEWKCETCQETGFGSHSKPPNNCISETLWGGVRENNKPSTLRRIKLGELVFQCIVVIFFFISLSYLAYMDLQCVLKNDLGVWGVSCNPIQHARVRMH